MKTKRLLSLILAVAMLLSVASMSAVSAETESLTLTDIDPSVVGETVSKSVERLVSMGIINGYPDGTFKPNNSITRAEFCVVMVKFEGMQDYINPDALTGFEDLDTDANYAWARPYVAMAVQRGIINGFEDKTFRAAEPVTYEQAIKMIVCSLGYGKQAEGPTIPGDWSSGYVAQAMRLRVTTGTTSHITTKTQPTTRGVVAVLVNNALDVDKADIETPEGDQLLPGGTQGSNLQFEDVKGIVTGTFITELENGDSSVPRNHIMIDEDIYEIGFSTDPNEFLGCEVNAVINNDNDGDYPIAVSLSKTSRTSVVQIDADLVGTYEDGILEYQTSRNGHHKEAKIDEDYITIFNNKAYNYDISDLDGDLENGNVVLVDNNGDKKYDVVRINSYEVFVVASKNSSSQKITFMYDAEYEGESTITFPSESTSVIFSLTRNGKEIKFSDISKWDVLNIKRSPADADGKEYYEVVVTRETVSGTITERDSDDENAIVIGSDEYYISDEFMEYDGDDKPALAVGDYTQVYLDASGKIVAAAEANNKMSSEKYAYLVALRQDSSDSDYDLEFKFYTTDGKFIQIGAASKITIDNTKYKALDEDILEYLSTSADAANANYSDAENVGYRQPIIYQTNTEGLVSTIYTVLSEDNEDISMVMEDENGDPYYAEYEERTYKSSSKSFGDGDFKVSSSTDIVFIPDNRGDTDDYLTFSSYSKAFANGRKYHVEAFGLTSSGTAALVLIYSQNDSRIYTSSSPWMIVASKSETKDGTVIKGYAGTSYTLKTVKVSEDEGPSVSAIGKGDIIRYILDNNNELVDYQVWFDASEPGQLEPVNDIDEVYTQDTEDMGKRIMEIHSTSTDPRANYPSATFRLQYGTVTDIILNNGEDDEIDEETIDVSPVIVEDGLEMDAFGDNGTVSKTISSSVKVFYYDRGGRNSDVVTEADLSEILPYDEYGDDATRVIIYTASGTLRMIYIIAE